MTVLTVGKVRNMAFISSGDRYSALFFTEISVVVRYVAKIYEIECDSHQYDSG